MKDIIHKLEAKEYEGQKIYVQCCVCQRYKGTDGNYYVGVEEHNELISHSYCPPCMLKVREEYGLVEDSE